MGTHPFRSTTTILAQQAQAYSRKSTSAPHTYCGWAYGGRVLKRKKISGVPAANAKAPPIKKVALDCLDLAAVKGYPSFLISNIIFIPRFLRIHGTCLLSVTLTPYLYVNTAVR